MNKSYQHLFEEMCKTAETLAEQVLEYNMKTNNQEGSETAQHLRDSFGQLADSIEKANKNNQPLSFSINQYRMLLAAAYTMRTHLETYMNNVKKAIDGYNIDIIPKLARMVDEGKDEQKIKELEKEIFDFSEEK